MALGITWPEDLAKEEGRIAPVELAELWVKEKVAYNAGQRSGQVSVITQRWSGMTRVRSVAGSPAAVKRTFWCADYNPQGNVPGQVPFGRK